MTAHSVVVESSQAPKPVKHCADRPAPIWVAISMAFGAGNGPATIMRCGGSPPLPMDLWLSEAEDQVAAPVFGKTNRLVRSALGWLSSASFGA